MEAISRSETTLFLGGGLGGGGVGRGGMGRIALELAYAILVYTVTDEKVATAQATEIRLRRSRD